VSLSLEEFRTLKPAPKGGKRKKIVPWDKIIEELRGRIVTFDDVKEIVQKYKKKFHHSEWYRIVTRMQEKLGIPVEVRQDDNGKTYYGIDLPPSSSEESKPSFSSFLN